MTQINPVIEHPARCWEIPVNVHRQALGFWLDDTRRIIEHTGVESNGLGLPDSLVIDPERPETFRGQWRGQSRYDPAVSACLLRLRHRVPATRIWVEGDPFPGLTANWRDGVDIVARLFG